MPRPAASVSMLVAFRSALHPALWSARPGHAWRASRGPRHTSTVSSTVGGAHHPPIATNHVTSTNYVPGFYCIASWRDTGPLPVPASKDDVNPDAPTCFVLHGILGNASQRPAIISSVQNSMSLKYEPASEPLHIAVKWKAQIAAPERTTPS